MKRQAGQTASRLGSRVVHTIKDPEVRIGEFGFHVRMQCGVAFRAENLSYVKAYGGRPCLRCKRKLGMKSNTRQKKPRRPDTCRHDRMLNVGYVCVDCVGAALKAYDNWAKQPDPSSCESNTLDDGAATDRLVRAMERLKKDSKGAR